MSTNLLAALCYYSGKAHSHPFNFPSAVKSRLVENGMRITAFDEAASCSLFTPTRSFHHCFHQPKFIPPLSDDGSGFPLLFCRCNCALSQSRGLMTFGATMSRKPNQMGPAPSTSSRSAFFTNSAPPSSVMPPPLPLLLPLPKGKRHAAH